ncbi:hypothetical protein JCM8097_001053 [Rhodosporidiobolus ruineniae]
MSTDRKCNLASCSTEATKQCSKCKSVYYCGRDHQTKDWQAHKKTCGKASAAAAAAKPSSSSSSSAFRPINERPPPQLNLHATMGVNPSSAMDFMKQFSAFPEGSSKEEMRDRLIDAFRLWCDDMYAWNSETVGLYNQEDPYPEFVDFLNKAKPHLPASWTQADTDAVLKTCQAEDSPLQYAMEKADFNEKWGSSTAAMATRMWTEKVTGVKIGGRF